MVPRVLGALGLMKGALRETQKSGLNQGVRDGSPGAWRCEAIPATCTPSNAYTALH